MFMKIFLIACLLNLVTSQTAEFIVNALPNGAQMQYAIVSTPANWYKASQICSLNGYLLTSILSADMQAFISSSLMNIGIFSTDSFWIGGNDDAVENRFYWEQGDPLTYSNWKASSPNSGTQGNCILLLSQHHNYKWDDENCNTPHMYICEKQIPGMSLENSQIISSLETAQTYVILNNQLDYPTAENYCQLNGMKLISNMDATESLVIQQILTQVGIPGEQVWVSPEEECNRRDLSFFAYNNCTKVEFSQSGQILLHEDSLCIEQHYVICEKSFFEVY